VEEEEREGGATDRPGEGDPFVHRNSENGKEKGGRRRRRSLAGKKRGKRECYGMPLYANFFSGPPSKQVAALLSALPYPRPPRPPPRLFTCIVRSETLLSLIPRVLARRPGPGPGPGRAGADR